MNLLFYFFEPLASRTLFSSLRLAFVCLFMVSVTRNFSISYISSLFRLCKIRYLCPYFTLALLHPCTYVVSVFTILLRRVASALRWCVGSVLIKGAIPLNAPQSNSEPSEPIA